MSILDAEPAPLALDPIQRLTRDLKLAALTLSPGEARFLVDYYYVTQEHRKATYNQERSLVASEEPHEVISWLAHQTETLEHQILRALDSWTDGQELGRWCKQITGIGPVIAAGLLAHIDITKCPTAGNIWSFAGLNPSVEWLGTERAEELVKAVCTGKEVTAEELAVIASKVNRKTANIRRLAEDEQGRITPKSLAAALAKRPWNTPLKRLCWLISESFVKVQNNPKDFYGKLYAERKVAEWGRDLSGEYAERAQETLKKKRIGKTTEAYRWYSGGYSVPDDYEYLGGRPELPGATDGDGQPMLPPDHIHSRSKRWVVKLFLSHYHLVAYWVHHGKLPPKPYVITYMNHSDMILPPNTESIPGLHAALKKWEASGP